MAYEPIIKKKNFCPNPIAKYGIPDIADSILNPKVVNTVAYEDWWNEQIERCVKGYNTGGLHIPGRYYWYLNFCRISTLERGLHYPEYVDIDYDFFMKIEQAKAEYKGIISLKKRRAGVSSKESHAIVGHGVRFNSDSYCAGIIAGEEKYSEGFFNKFKTNSIMVPNEFRLHELNSNEELWKAGYQYLNEQKIWTVGGSLNNMLCRTAKKTPNVFKGEMFNDVIFEEGGEFGNLLDCFGATKACFQVGNKMVGTPHVYGTGGNIKTASKDFKAMYHEADAYELLKIDIMGPRMMVGFFCGSVNEKGKQVQYTPNIDKIVKEKRLSPEQVLGCEDVKAAEDEIHKERKRLSTAKNKKKYYDYFQDNPLNAKDAFLTFSANDFSPDKLAEQAYIVSTMAIPNYAKWKLEWVKDDKGMTKIPLQVVAEPAKDEEEEEKCVLIWQHPETKYKNLDVAGIDSYDIDKSATSKSLGAIVVFRRHNNIKGLASRKPIAVYYYRPERKEMFYEICLKLCVYYNLKNNALVDIRNGVIIKYFEQFGGEKYLAPRPLAFESENSEQAHQWGVSLNVYSKPKMVSLLQTWVYDHIQGCWFPRIIEDLQGYDVSAKESDWDAADALGIALMRDADMSVMVTGDDVNKWDAADLPSQYQTDDGETAYRKNSSDKQQEPAKDPFIRMMEEGRL